MWLSNYFHEDMFNSAVRAFLNTYPKSNVNEVKQMIKNNERRIDCLDRIDFIVEMLRGEHTTLKNIDLRGNILNFIEENEYNEDVYPEDIEDLEHYLKNGDEFGALKLILEIDDYIGDNEYFLYLKDILGNLRNDIVVFYDETLSDFFVMPNNRRRFK